MPKAEFIDKVRFLSEPHPYKILHGGRYGVKSWSIAQQLVLDAARDKHRTLCCREVQHSIRESVHENLSQTIQRIGLGDKFEVLDYVIRARETGSEFVFAGLKDKSAEGIKSYESCDRAWIEEAQRVSKRSRQLLIPTIMRNEGAEIWVSMNPDMESDDAWRYWVKDPPPGAVVRKTNWKDNRWLTEAAQLEIADAYRRDPKDAANIYGGEPKGVVTGAIFGAEMETAQIDGRVGEVPYMRTHPVDTFWDLGYGDMMAIWFVQNVNGWYNFIDYEQGERLTIADWMVILQQKGYVYGTDYVPHDAVDAIIHHRLTGDRSKSVEMLMRAAGRKVRVVPKLHVASRINAGRTIFPQCRFDESRCLLGINALRNYQWGPIDENKPEVLRIRKAEPLHNWASHGADAFTEAGVTLKQPVRKADMPKVLEPPRTGAYAPFS